MKNETFQTLLSFRGLHMWGSPVSLSSTSWNSQFKFFVCWPGIVLQAYCCILSGLLAWSVTGKCARRRLYTPEPDTHCAACADGNKLWVSDPKFLQVTQSKKLPVGWGQHVVNLTVQLQITLDGDPQDFKCFTDFQNVLVSGESRGDNLLNSKRY